jgi:ADP-ribose pyrophosphatase YjhB (NUDIX family)
MDIENKKRFIVRSRAIIMHEGKLFVVYHPDDTSFAALPGGHLEWGEDPYECLSRELVEELGIAPSLGRLLYVNTFVLDEERQSFEFFIEVLNGEEYFAAKEFSGTHAHEIAGTRWVGQEDDVRILPRELAEDLKQGAILSDATRTIFGTK